MQIFSIFSKLLSMHSIVKEPCEASTSFTDFLVFATLGLNYTASYHFEFFFLYFMKGFKLYTEYVSCSSAFLECWLLCLYSLNFLSMSPRVHNFMYNKFAV